MVEFPFFTILYCVEFALELTVTPSPVFAIPLFEPAPPFPPESCVVFEPASTTPTTLTLAFPVSIIPAPPPLIEILPCAWLYPVFALALVV